MSTRRAEEVFLPSLDGFIYVHSSPLQEWSGANEDFKLQKIQVSQSLDRVRKDFEEKPANSKSIKPGSRADLDDKILTLKVCTFPAQSFSMLPPFLRYRDLIALYEVFTHYYKKCFVTIHLSQNQLNRENKATKDLVNENAELKSVKLETEHKIKSLRRAGFQLLDTYTRQQQQQPQLLRHKLAQEQQSKDRQASVKRMYAFPPKDKILQQSIDIFFAKGYPERG